MFEHVTKRRRARWKRNKKAARSRNAPVQYAPSAELVARVLAERDRRAVISRQAEFLWRDSWFYQDGSWEKATSFVADVWTATTLLEIQFGRGNSTPTRIANWLISNGRGHGYGANSLRTKVYQARRRIRALEQHYDWWGGPLWEPFDPRVGLGNDW